MKRAYTLALVASVMSVYQSCTVGRIVRYNFVGIEDYKIFPSRPLPKSTTPFMFTESPQAKIGRFQSAQLDSIASVNGSVAFLVIRNDSLLFEHYYNGYDKASTISSFSIAKSYISALVGIALAEGLIVNIDEPITNYIPELKKRKGFDQIKIKYLLQMTSGISGPESSWNPFGYAARLYYGRNMRNYLFHLKIKTHYPPGTHWAYSSINTELLGLILERVSHKTLTEFMFEKLWRHMGTEYDASWSIDKKADGMEKAFCCLNAKARDFAKLGRLYLNMGNWNGQQLLPKEWVEESTSTTTEDGVRFYKYHWWLMLRNDKSVSSFFANGHLEQLIYVNPKRNVIIVRLGKNSGSERWISLFEAISNTLK